MKGRKYRREMLGEQLKYPRRNKKKKARKRMEIEEAREAALCGKDEELERGLRENPALAREADDSSYTLLHHACGYGSARGVALLLAAGADPERKDSDGFTPLHWAAGARRADALEALERGGWKARCRAENLSGKSPLSTAIQSGCARSAKSLLSMGYRGSSLDLPGDHPWVELIRVSRKPGWAREGNPEGLAREFALELDRAGISREDESREGNEIALRAALWENEIMLRLLRERGDSLERENASGISPLWACARDGKVRGAAELLRLGCDPVRKTRAGKSPLEVAAAAGNAEMLALLESAALGRGMPGEESGGEGSGRWL